MTEQRSLTERAIVGAKWSALARAISVGFQFVTTAILARLLSPEAFGLVGMAAVAVGLAQMLVDLGMSAGIVQRLDVTRTQLSTLFWLNLLAGVVAASLLVASAPLVVGFYREPQLQSLLVWSAASFLILSAGQQFSALLQRELEFQTLARLLAVEVLAGGVTSVAAAWFGAGAVSLVWGNFVRAGVRSFTLLILAVKHGWLPEWTFPRGDVRRFIGFGLYQMGERSINFLSGSLDFLLIGRYLSAHALGHYSMAYTIAYFPLLQINPVITQVAFPVFSRIQDDNRALRRGYTRVISTLALATFPLIGGMFAVAPSFVRLVFGEAWLPAAPVIQAFCLLSAVKTVCNPLGSLILAKGRADFGFWLNVLVIIGRAAAVLAGIPWGIVGVAMALTAVDVLLLPLDFYVLNRLISMTPGDLWAAVRVPTQAAAVMIAALFFLRLLWVPAAPAIGFFYEVVAGGATYALTVYLLSPPAFRHFWSLIREHA